MTERVVQMVFLLLAAGLLLGGCVLVHATKSENTRDFNSDVRSSAAEITPPTTISKLMLASVDDDDISYLVFQPMQVDFKRNPIGEAQNVVVALYNKHNNRSVQMLSISGSAPEFYSSFFKKSIIPPQGNTSFNVVFLPRKQGPITGALKIQTSFGAAEVAVVGDGAPCVYRLTPLVDLEAPLNATLTPEISIYNPHGTPLQILEVYSSSEQFPLELPNGDNEGPQTLWEIPPYSLTPIIRVRFRAITPGNYTAYVRVKVSAEAADVRERVLVVPVEVEVLSHRGVYAAQSLLNFGLAGNTDRSKEIQFDILNSGVNITDIMVVEIYFNYVRFEYLNDSDCQNNIVTRLSAKIDWSQLPDDAPLDWFFLINAIDLDGSVSITHMPIVASVIKGGISFNENSTIFVSSQKTEHSKPFALQNKFEMSLAVTEVSYSDHFHRYFQLTNFNPPYIIQPNDTLKLFQLSIRNSSNNNSIEQSVFVHTNVSVYEIKVSRFSGLLRRVYPQSSLMLASDDAKSMNFGTLPLGVASDAVIAFANDNPVAIPIVTWKGTISGAGSIVMILRGCGPAESTTDLVLCSKVKPGDWVVYQMSVSSGVVGTFSGRFTIRTENEEVVTGVRFATAMGRLDLETVLLKFRDCFPGKRCVATLIAHSTFLKPMRLKNVTVKAGIKYERYGCNLSADLDPDLVCPSIEIPPNVVTNIGQLVVDVRHECTDGVCYTGVDTDTWFKERYHRRENDREQLTAHIENFRAMRQRLQQISIWLTTNQIKRQEFQVPMEVVWPRLVERPINFPVVQVGYELIMFITVHNPSDYPLIVQFSLYDALTGDPDIISYAPEAVVPCASCTLTSTPNVFSLVPINLNSPSPLETLAPHTSAKVAVMFSAKEVAGTHSTLLFVRNNLTLIEAAWLTAKAVVPQFKFGNRKPGSTTPLLFEITDKHLRECDRQKRSGEEMRTSVVTKRTFTARNTGEVPIIVSGIRIGGRLCEGFGFKVLHCSTFELAPNGSRKLEVAFTPDFTLARVTRPLELETSLDYSVNYTLLGTVPSHTLATCGRSLMRPPWEATMKNVSISILVIAFICVLFAAFLDSDKILKDHVQNISRDKGPLQPPLDLRQIAALGNTRDSANTVRTNSPPAKPVISKENGSKKKVAKKLLVREESSSSSTTTSSSFSTKKSWAAELAGKLTSKRKSDPTKALPRKEYPKNKKDIVDKPPVEVSASSAHISDTSSATLCDATIPKIRHSNSPTQPKAPSASPPSSQASPDLNEKKISHKRAKSAQPSPIEEPIAKESKQTRSAQKLSVTNTTTTTTKDMPIPKPSCVCDKQKTNTIESTTKESPTEQLFMKKGADSGRRPGKTPGRERQKKKENFKRINSKPSIFKGTAFQFSAPLPPAIPQAAPPISPIWDQGQASFSYVVAQKPTTTDEELTGIYPLSPDRSNPLISAINIGIQTTQSITNEFSNPPKYHTNEIPLENTTPLQRKSMDLGPIGTRKSPSLTPVWEPMPTTSQMHKPIPTNSNSFFSEPIASHHHHPQHRSPQHKQSQPHQSAHMYQPQHPTFTSNQEASSFHLLDSLYADSLQNQRTWNSSSSESLLYSLLERQNQFANLQQWNSNTSWAPMRYSPDGGTIPSYNDASAAGMWNNSSNNMNGHHQEAIRRPPPGLDIGHRNGGNRPSNRNDNQNMNDMNAVETELPPFDPFRSLSSIWNSSWSTGADRQPDNN